MNPTPPEVEKRLGKDLKTFEQLPAKTKELEALQEQAEKTVGEESAVLHQEILDRDAECSSDLLSTAADNKINQDKRLPVVINKRPKE